MKDHDAILKNHENQPRTMIDGECLENLVVSMITRTSGGKTRRNHHLQRILQYSTCITVFLSCGTIPKHMFLKWNNTVRQVIITRWTFQIIGLIFRLVGKVLINHHAILCRSIWNVGLVETLSNVDHFPGPHQSYYHDHFVIITMIILSFCHGSAFIIINIVIINIFIITTLQALILEYELGISIIW